MIVVNLSSEEMIVHSSLLQNMNFIQFGISELKAKNTTLQQLQTKVEHPFKHCCNSSTLPKYIIVMVVLGNIQMDADKCCRALVT